MLHFLYDMFRKDTFAKNRLESFKQRVKIENYVPVVGSHQEKMDYLVGIDSLIKHVDTSIEMYKYSLTKMQNRIFGFENQLFVKCNRTGMATLEKEHDFNLDSILSVRSTLELVQELSNGWVLRQECPKPVLDLSFQSKFGIHTYGTLTKFNVDVSKI